MKLRDRKLVILRQLGQEAEPVKLSVLTGKLGPDFTDRTVRRWLHQLIDEGMVTKSGRTKDAKYLVVKRKDNAINGTSSCFGTESLKVIARITSPLHSRMPVAYNDEWFDSYEPNISFYPLTRENPVVHGWDESRLF